MSFYVRKLEEKLVYQVKFYIYIFKNEHTIFMLQVGLDSDFRKTSLNV